MTPLIQFQAFNSLTLKLKMLYNFEAKEAEDNKRLAVFLLFSLLQLLFQMTEKINYQTSNQLTQ